MRTHAILGLAGAVLLALPAPAQPIVSGVMDLDRVAWKTMRDGACGARLGFSRIPNTLKRFETRARSDVLVQFCADASVVARAKLQVRARIDGRVLAPHEGTAVGALFADGELAEAGEAVSGTTCMSWAQPDLAPGRHRAVIEWRVVRLPGAPPRPAACVFQRSLWVLFEDQ